MDQIWKTCTTILSIVQHKCEKNGCQLRGVLKPFESLLSPIWRYNLLDLCITTNNFSAGTAHASKLKEILSFTVLCTCRSKTKGLGVKSLTLNFKLFK